MTWQDKYKEWKTHPDLNQFEKENLNALNEEEAEEAFSHDLSFGTAGMRGIIGAGTNRMNVYTVRKASQGLAHWILAQGEEPVQQGVVIAYDNRHFSQTFAQQAAQILGQAGILTYVFESLRPTPELSFAVRYLKCFAGIMITASHNPPNYNGYKVYNQTGGQIGPEEAEELTRFIQDIDHELELECQPYADLIENGWVKEIAEQVDQPYLQALKTVNAQLDPQVARDLSIVFAPLHGAGGMVGKKALQQAGFSQLHLVEEQMVADPDFSTVKSPNPEEAAAFDLAIDLGHQQQADILLATDPDADRLGLAVLNDQGNYDLLNGNQMAALMVDYILSRQQAEGVLDQQARLVKSLVSGELPAEIAKDYGIQTDNVLTGFKFIADKIQSFEDSQEASFLFGFEESYGFLIQPFVRDKDAIQALLLISEMAAVCKLKGKNLTNRLQELYEQYGYYLDKTLSVQMPGAQGQAHIQSLLEGLREDVPSDFAGINVQKWEDYRALKVYDAQGKEIGAIDSPSSNVLKYFLEDGSWIAWRPSGTEPKIKTYLSVRSSDLPAAQDKLKKLQASCQALIQADR